MEFLGEWLREIVIVVLIAVFIDLLLPNRSMERYVKFVVNLLILLTLLSPVLRLFSSDAERQIEAAFADDWGGSEASGLAASTEVILRQGEELKKQHEQEALQWAGEEVARQIKQQIERETGMPVIRVTVKISEGKPPNGADSKNEDAGIDPSIQSVEVIMRREGDATVQETMAAERQGKVLPVEKVRVDISDSPASEAMADAERNEAGGAGSDSSKRGSIPVAEIEKLLYQEWGISKEAVTVIEEDANKN